MAGENFSPSNGKLFKNDGSIVNIADLFVNMNILLTKLIANLLLN